MTESANRRSILHPSEMRYRLRWGGSAVKLGAAEDSAAVARLLATVLGVGGLLLLVSLLLPGSDSRETGALAAVGAASLLAGVVYLAAYERASRRLLVAGPVLGAVFVALAVYFAGPDASVVYGLALAAVVVTSAACFPAGTVVGHGIFALVAYAVALDAADGPAHLLALNLLVAGGTIAVAGTIVFGLSAQLRGLSGRLADAARTDALTGLLNRRALDEGFEIELARSRRTRSAVSLVVLDLDHFQRFNDQRGHQAGDLVLSRLANVLKDTTRNVDLSARIGGEEFAVLAPETGIPGGLALAERLRRAIEIEFSGESPRLSVSLGVAGSPGNGGDRQQLMKAAGVALEEAKTTGRNKAVVSSVKAEPQVEDRRVSDPVA